MVARCCGGGGYGDPLRRDPERVVDDVAEGWISRARAFEVYAVALTEAGVFDGAATERERRARVAVI